MANTRDLLGSLLGRGMTESSASRIEHSLSDKGMGGLGGILEQLGLAPTREPAAVPAGREEMPLGREMAQPRRDSAQVGRDMAAPRRESIPTAPEADSGNPLDALGSLGELAKSFLGDGPQGKSLAAGGLGALIGSILGGGGKSAKGAIGGGALALLGSIALQALRGANAQKSAPQEIDAAGKLAAGLRAPESPQEEQEVQSILDLTVKAMINAAKSDGRIDEDEMQKFVGEMQEDGISQEEREYLLTEVRKPMCTDEIVRAVPNRQVAAQVYAASLLAIEVDTPAEKAYIQKLARDLKLDAPIVSQIHTTLGLA